MPSCSTIRSACKAGDTPPVLGFGSVGRDKDRKSNCSFGTAHRRNNFVVLVVHACSLAAGWQPGRLMWTPGTSLRNRNELFLFWSTASVLEITFGARSQSARSIPGEDPRSQNTGMFVLVALASDDMNYKEITFGVCPQSARSIPGAWSVDRTRRV